MLILFSLLGLFVILRESHAKQILHFSDDTSTELPPWLINYPKVFQSNQMNGRLVDIKNDTQAMISFQSSVQDQLDHHSNAAVDGEVVDALVHFF